MADPVVYDTLTRPGESPTPPPRGKVTVYLAGEDGAYVVGYLPDDDLTIHGVQRPTVNADGEWEIALPTNDRIEPAGTVWAAMRQVDGMTTVDYFTLPDDSGRHWLFDHLTDPPSDLVPPNLAVEIAARIAADAELQAQIDAVEASDVDSVNGRTGVVTGLAEQADLDDEISRASAAEAELQDQITDEVAERTAALAAEVTARNAAIAAATLGLFDDRGGYNASSNVFPTTGGSGTAGAVLKGDVWTVTVAGALGGVAVVAGDLVRALVDSPGQTAGNWSVAEHNLGYVPENVANKSTSTSLGTSDTAYPSQKAVKTYVDAAVAQVDASSVHITGNETIAGNKTFRDIVTIREAAGDTGDSPVIARTVGDTSAGTIQMRHDGDYGYIFHLTTTANVPRPWAAMGIGSDYDSNGLFVSNKLTGNGILVTNTTAVTSATGGGHGIEGRQQAPIGTVAGVDPALVYLYAVSGGEAPLLQLQAKGTPTTDQVLLSVLGPSATYGQIKASDGTFDWLAPVKTTNYFQVNSGSTGAKSYLNANAGVTKDFEFQSGGSSRWSLRSNSTAESGSDVGSDFEIISRSDSGAFKSTVLRIARSDSSFNFADGVNLALGTATGTKIGTGTTQKLGFYNATPVAQQAGTTDVLASLVTLGLRAASSNPPLNLGTGTLTCGALAVTRTSATAQAALSADAGQNREVAFQTGSSSRWILRSDNTAESGSDAGSDFQLISRTDAGAFKLNVLSIARSTGVVTFGSEAVTAASTATRAGLRLPHGAAPSSPANGDMWTTTAGLFVHINGSTVGPLT